MIRLKYFENFKLNNLEGGLITLEDVINCIKKNGSLYATIVNDMPKNDPSIPIRPLSVDNEGLVTVDVEGIEYTVHLKNIEKLDF